MYSFDRSVRYLQSVAALVLTILLFSCAATTPPPAYQQLMSDRVKAISVISQIEVQVQQGILTPEDWIEARDAYRHVAKAHDTAAQAFTQEQPVNDALADQHAAMVTLLAIGMKHHITPKEP